MFINKQQQPHGQYGRDQCIGCLRRLGFGLDKLARTLHLHERTLAKVIQKRITVERYAGFDSEWAKLRNSNLQQRKKRERFEASWLVTLNKFVVEEITADILYWEKYDSMYCRRYRELTQARRNKVKRYKKDLKGNPETYAAYVEKERINSHRRKGKLEHEIPAKGKWLLTCRLSPEQQKEINRIRRKREYLRKLVREVWKGEVGDSAAIYRVGCSVGEFQAWVALKSRPEWNEVNYGKIWNFDHVLPCASFDVFDSTQVKRLNHYTNIRPCCVMENSIKGSNL